MKACLPAFPSGPPSIFSILFALQWHSYTGYKGLTVSAVSGMKSSIESAPELS